jgi:Xaa-Pro aminopeptidase
MKADLDEEMSRRGLDWLILSGPRYCNPDSKYMLGEASVLHPIIIKRRGEEPTVIHNSLERGEVARWSLRGIDSEEILSRDDLAAIPGAQTRGTLFYARLIERFGITGRLAFYGFDDIQRFSSVLREIAGKHPALELVEDLRGSVFQMARQTKDDRELHLMRDVARKTCLIFEELFRFLKKGRMRDGGLIDEGGAPVTLGDLRRLVYMEMARHNLMAAETPIISMARDAAFPHSLGRDDDELAAGKSIILDIFPRSLSTGYVCDITRTVCIGEAPPRMKALYGSVLEAQKIAMDLLHIGEHFSLPDIKVSEFFHEKGYPTLWKEPRGNEGYAHSLGHGIGLELHERPRLSVFNRDNEECTFKPRMVFTIEPGLYFPGEEMGVRVEDAVILREDGTLEILSPLPRTLEIYPEG